MKDQARTENRLFPPLTAADGRAGASANPTAAAIPSAAAATSPAAAASFAAADPAEGSPLAAAADHATHFRHVDTWVFDLDNTLYPAGSDLWPKIDERITLYLIRLFGLDAISSRALQKYYYQRYGTTLRGLVVDHGVSFEDYLSFVHDVDRSSLMPDHSLAAAITALPGRKLILTNGSRDHALRTAEALGLDAMFEDVFDIVAADLVPKPEGATYRRFFDKHGVDPTQAAMFEDIAQNLLVPHQRGMRTTLVVPQPGAADHREAFEIAGPAHPPHVHFVTSNLADFLRAITFGAAGEDEQR